MNTTTHIEPGKAVKYVPPRVAAETLGVCPQTVRRWAKAGIIPHYVTRGGRYRYDLAAFLGRLQRRAA